MKEHLLRFKKDQPYVFFDFETCGLNLGSLRNKPWQLAFLVVENERIIERANYWLKWDNLNVSPGAAKVTGWTAQKYADMAVDPEAPLLHFESYLYNKKYIKVGHNILGFDVYMHGIYRRLLNKSPDYSYLGNLIDTLCLSRALNNDISLQKSDCLLHWQYKMLSLRKAKGKNRLIDLCRQFKIPFDTKKLHDALYDIEKNYEVFQKLLWAIEV